MTAASASEATTREARGRSRLPAPVLLNSLIVVSATAACVVAAVAVAHLAHHPPSTIPLLVVGLLALGGELAQLPVALGNRKLWVAWGEASLLLGLCFAPPAAVVLLQAVAVAVDGAVNRRPLRRTIFNIAATTLATAGAAGVVLASPLAPTPPQPMSWLWLLPAAAASTTASTAFIAAAVSLSSDGRLLTTVRTLLRTHLPVVAANLVLSLLILTAWRYSKPSLLLLPLVLLAVSPLQGRYLRGMTERDALHRLASASRPIAALSMEEVAEEIHLRANDLFGARAELQLGENLATPQELSAEGPTVDLPLRGRNDDLGVLRLHFEDAVALTAQERDVLVTFANSIAAAVETVQAHLAQLHDAQHDPLTGLPNRSLFGQRVNEALAQARQSGERCALLLLGLDQFKNVNDTLGHASGDRLLQEIAARLANSVRVGDEVARLGGDEFVVLLRRLDEAVQAEYLAASLLERVRTPAAIDGLRLSVEASVGTAMFPSDADDLPSLLRCADIALNRAKRRGQSVTRYEASSDPGNPDRLVLLTEMQAALDEEQLVLHYQPQFDLGSGRLSGVEALVRWKHPARGLLGPGEFIPAVEQSSLIGPLTLYVLERAVLACLQWQAHPLLRGVGVSVNLSARNLLHRDLPDEIARILARHGLPARLLVLEITETAAMNDAELGEQVLARLRDLGTRLSVDDFGTGYASLTFLRRIDVGEVKLDRAFVADMTSDEAAAVIISATTELAHGLGLTVVAEGVETLDQLRALRERGCDEAQGFLLGRPVALEQLPAVVATGRGRLSAAGALDRMGYPVPRAGLDGTPGWRPSARLA